MNSQDRITLAEIQRERGNRGEVLAASLTDVPGRLQKLRSAWVRFVDGTDTEVSIDEAWPHKDGWVLKFAGVNTISDAERFRRAELWVPRSERGTLGEREWFQSDLIGCALVDEVSGRSVGTVKAWQEFGGPALMVVACEGKEVLVPFVGAFCRTVDLETKQVRMAYPDGMLAELLDLE